MSCLIDVASTAFYGSFPGLGLSLSSSCRCRGLKGLVKWCLGSTYPFLCLNGIFPITLWISIHWCLDNVCISLYYFLPPLEFRSRFKIALNFHPRYLPVRIKIYSLGLVSVVAHPMISRLCVCVEIHNATLDSIWMLW